MSARPSPVDAVLIGAGVRGTFAYGAFAEAHPEHWYMFRRMWPVGPANLPARLEEAVA